jgi:glycosyltransferase involved in cell wall biosynthesis
MKILQVTSAADVGGGETHLAGLARGLMLRGHDVSVLTRPRAPVRELLDFLPADRLRALPLYGGGDLLSALRLASFVRGARFDVVHAHRAHDYPRAAFAAWRAGARFVATRHVMYPLGRAKRFVLRRAHAVIAVSEPVRAALLLNGVTPARLKLIENGIDVARFAAASPEPFLAAHPSLRGAPLVGMLGAPSPEKGHDVFVRAAAIVGAARPDVRFVVAGGEFGRDAARLDELRDLANAGGVGGRIVYAPRSEDAAPILRALDVVVSPSRTEAFGLVIAEAMAAGAAIVASATPGASTLLRDGETGLLVPIDDPAATAQAVLRLLNDVGLRRRLGGAAAIEAAQRFDVRRMVEETERAYEERRTAMPLRARAPEGPAQGVAASQRHP